LRLETAGGCVNLEIDKAVEYVILTLRPLRPCVQKTDLRRGSEDADIVCTGVSA